VQEQDVFRDNSNGFINFDSYDCQVAIDKTIIKLTIKGSSREFLFKAANEEEAKAWYYEMKNHIWYSRGKNGNIAAP